MLKARVAFLWGSKFCLAIVSSLAKKYLSLLCVYFVMGKLDPRIIEERRKGVTEALREFNVSEKAIKYLAEKKRFNGSDINERLERLREAKGPLTGIIWKLGLSQPGFEDLIKRYKSEHRFTPAQQEVFDFLISKEVSKSVALRVAKTPLVRPGEVRKRVEYLESIRLDPAKYGVQKVPARFYEKVLHWQLRRIKLGVLRYVLHPLEDSFAVQKLGKAQKDWRKIKGKSRIRPATLLRNISVAHKNGVQPFHIVVTRNSAEKIASLQTKARSNPNKNAIVQQLSATSALDEYASQAEVRRLIVTAMLARPHASVGMKWLRTHFVDKEKIGRREFNRALGELSDIGVVSKRKGYLTVSTWFRMRGSNIQELTNNWDRKLNVLSQKAKQRGLGRRPVRRL